MSATILIVDDNSDLAENIAEIFADEGCDVATATSGEQALELAEGRHFDVVLSDIRMPGISGIELVRRLASRDPGTHYLLMTAYTSDALLREARSMGVVRAVLAKPLAVEQLLSLLPRGAGSE
jgi:CheY-like chemotaxis protein